MTAEAFHLCLTWPGIREVTDAEVAYTARRITRESDCCGRYGACWWIEETGEWVCDDRALDGRCYEEENEKE